MRAIYERESDDQVAVRELSLTHQSDVQRSVAVCDWHWHRLWFVAQTKSNLDANGCTIRHLVLWFFPRHGGVRHVRVADCSMIYPSSRLGVNQRSSGWINWCNRPPAM